MAEEAYRNCNALARENAVVVLVRKVPYLCENGGLEFGAIEYLDGSVTGDDTQLLGICLGEYLVDERNLSGRWRKFGHDYDASLEEGRSGCAEYEMGVC